MNVFKTKESSQARDQVLQTTALLYFKESLWNEAFENSAELADLAREFGAQPNAIGDVIAEYLGGMKAGYSEAYRQKNRLNLLKEEH